MIRNNRFLTLLLSVFLLLGFTQLTYTSAAESVDATDAPQEVRALFKKHSLEAESLYSFFAAQDPYAIGGANVCQVPWLPGYFIKNGVCRYSNSNELEEWLRLNDFSEDVTVVKKFLLHIPDQPYTVTNGHYLVIEPEVIGMKVSQIKNKNSRLESIFNSIEEIERRSFHTDLHDGNFLIVDMPSEGVKAVIIDTDHAAMPRDPERTVDIETYEKRKFISKKDLQRLNVLKRFAMADKIFKRQKEELAKLRYWEESRESPSRLHTRAIGMLKGAVRQHEQEIFELKDFVKQQEREIRTLKNFLVGTFIVGGVVGASVVAWSKYNRVQKV